MAKKKEDSSDQLSSGRNSLVTARNYLTKKKGKEFTDIRVALTEDNLKEPLPHIPSGCDVVDFLIGGSPNKFGVTPCPGFPRGRVSQMWGPEASGKTTLALTACAAVCAEGGTALYIDWENDIVPDYAMALGVPITNPDKFELLQPETLEDGIKYAAAYAAAGVDIIVFDSVGSAVPRRIAERDAIDVAEQSKVGDLQQIWSQELPNLKGVIARTGTAVIGISQVRATNLTGPGKKSGPQGGNAWKFYASVRLELRRVESLKGKEFNVLTHKADDRVIGAIVRVEAIKCKMSRSQGRAEIFYIRWGDGIDNVRTIQEIATAHGIIKKGGSWLSWEDAPGGSLRMQGAESLRAHLVNNPKLFEALRERVRPLLCQGAAEQYVEIDDLGQIGDSDEDLDKIMKDSGMSLGGDDEEAAPNYKDMPDDE